MDHRLRSAERKVHYKMMAMARWGPGQLVRAKDADLRATAGRLRRGLMVARDMQTKRLEAVEGRLRAVGPVKVLARGYSVTTDAASGELINDAGRLSVGQEVITRLNKGQVASTVKSTKK